MAWDFTEHISDELKFLLGQKRPDTIICFMCVLFRSSQVLFINMSLPNIFLASFMKRRMSPVTHTIQRHILHICLCFKWHIFILLDSPTKFCIKKLDGVGPVHNRHSTDKLHHFVQKEKKKKKNMWHVTYDSWHVTYDMWHVVGGEHSPKISAP